jgi:hypothetical protein
MPTNLLAENIEKAGKCKNPAFRRLSKKVASFFYATLLDVFLSINAWSIICYHPAEGK